MYLRHSWPDQVEAVEADSMTHLSRVSFAMGLGSTAQLRIALRTVKMGENVVGSERPPSLFLLRCLRFDLFLGSGFSD